MLSEVVRHMFNALDYPVLVLVASLVIFGFAAWVGEQVHARYGERVEFNHEDFTFVLGGTLTLLGLIIGFTFSMAVNRYDQRKNYEEQEANAIGTEYVRADLLPPADAAKVRSLLSSYLEQRILWYKSRFHGPRRQLDTQTARLQTELWSSVTGPTSAQPKFLDTLVVSGMNDVLNSQGYTQAMWWNRIPGAAWALLIMIGLFCNLLIGYGARGRSASILLILPIALGISLFLIADIDSPRGGVIRVWPQNLESLSESLRP